MLQSNAAAYYVTQRRAVAAETASTSSAAPRKQLRTVVDFPESRVRDYPAATHKKRQAREDLPLLEDGTDDVCGKTLSGPRRLRRYQLGRFIWQVVGVLAT